ncbi:MAG TPA: oligosaccharide flippase family protein, partial [Candidatus Kapabacteria bacterium]|nr:oligosaccharide flippase family protein [Candidatus Kapabacteria bacterium]
LLSGLGVQHNALMQRNMRFRERARIATTAVAISGTIALGAALLGAGPWALVAQAITSELITLCLLWRASDFRPGAFRWSRDAAEMLRFGGQFLLFRVLGYAAHNLQVVLVGREVGVAAAALYTRAYFFNRQILGYANDTAGQLANSALPKLIENPVRLRQFYLRCLNVIFLATAPVAVACGLHGADIVSFLFGPQWLAAGKSLEILSVGMALQPLLFSTGWLYFAYGDMAGLVRWGMFGWVVMIAAGIVGVRWGVQGVAWAWSAGIVLLALPCCHYAYQGRSIRLQDVLPIVSRPLGAALLAGAASSAASAALSLPSVYARLPVDACIMAATYFGLLWWPFGQRPLIDEIIQSLRRASPPHTSTLSSSPPHV